MNEFNLSEDPWDWENVTKLWVLNWGYYDQLIDNGYIKIKWSDASLSLVFWADSCKMGAKIELN